MTADRPWLFRTYAGHSTAAASNALYRANLDKGQTGLSVAFDLPTQTGYDSDHPLAAGEVGKVGVPVAHLGDMRALFDQIPLAQMNTSMTINATAPWLLALYIVVAEEQGADPATLQGTVQNDLIKEYLSRGTYICPPEPSMQMIADVAEYCRAHLPKWNPMNVCSYHLQEAGATPEQELAYALATACAVLDQLQNRLPREDFAQAVGRMSFFVNAGIRFVTELCKMRAFADLWADLCRDRYGVTDPKLTRFRYGVQVNSLGLTEQQPENNVHRILIEMLAVTLSKRARARAVQLPAWNEALGLPRPWDQQWSLRMQQILALETDLLEYDDLFDGNPAIERKVAELKSAALAELDTIDALGGAVKAIDYMKTRLVEANAKRIQAIEEGETTVVGVNAFAQAEPSPLIDGNGGILTVDPEVEADQIARLAAWRNSREPKAVDHALAKLREAAKTGVNIMPASVEAARAGVTTGEWAAVVRGVHGAYRGPTGVSAAPANNVENLDPLRDAVDQASASLGRRLSFYMGKPGLDGHSNGAEQISARARDCGIETTYAGIRLSPSEIVEDIVRADPHVIGFSVLSGNHVGLVEEVIERLSHTPQKDRPIVLGGIIPDSDQARLRQLGIKKVYTPKNFMINSIIKEVIDIAVS